MTRGGASADAGTGAAVVRVGAHLPRRSGRVALRRLTPADLGDFQAYRSDPAVGRYQGWSKMSDAEAAAFLSSMQQLDDVAPGTWLQIGIAAADDGRLIGDCAVVLREGAAEAEIGFTLSGRWQQRGLGREAVELLVDLAFAAAPAETVVAVTDARNLPARRLLAAVGLRHAKTDDAVFRGEPCVEHTFVVRRTERVGRC